MKIIDTHTHLYVEAFEEDRDSVIQNAIAHVERFYLPAIDSTYTPAMHALKEKYPEQIHLMMGLHPTHVKRNYKEELHHVHRSWLKTHLCVGEIE